MSFDNSWEPKISRGLKMLVIRPEKDWEKCLVLVVVTLRGFVRCVNSVSELALQAVACVLVPAIHGINRMDNCRNFTNSSRNIMRSLQRSSTETISCTLQA